MTSAPVVVHGSVAPGFDRVREAFVDNFRRGEEIGAAVAVYLAGVPVVDIWSGLADQIEERPWQARTVTTVYSVTKGATATLLNLLHQEEVLDLDRPIADYWPEFAQNGKATVTSRMILSHRGGLATIEERLPLDDLLDGVSAANALARQKPTWSPGTSHGYHVLTFGWLAGEIVRRVTGNSLGMVFDQKISKPLKLDFSFGVSSSGDIDFAPLVDGAEDPDELSKITDPELRASVEPLYRARLESSSLLARAFTTNGVLPAPNAAAWNSAQVLASELPAANGVTNARSMARLYAACVGEVQGVRLLSDATLDQAIAEQSAGPDLVTLRSNRFGTGYQLETRAAPLLGSTSFGHAGVGGALAFGDRRSKIGFGYTQNRIGHSMVNEARAARLVNALQSSLATIKETKH